MMTKIEKYFIKLCKENLLTVHSDGKVTNNKTGTELGHLNSNGYIKISHWIKKRTCSILVHRLVYLIYKGPIPKGMTINHKDANKQNNDIKNLECISFLNNMKHAYKNNLIDLQNRSSKVTIANKLRKL